MGKAAESTLIYAMLDNVPGDPDRFAHVREWELIVNVLSMAAVHRTVAKMEKDESDDSIPEWWADQSLDFGARSIRLLDVGVVQEFQSVLENHGWDLEFVNAYKSDDGSLASDLVAFIELALINNVEHVRVYGE